MTEPWNQGVRGTQVLPLINTDVPTIRVEAGPGTGKTFGLARRIQRALHPQGLNLQGSRVLVVAFNRAIAQQLATDIGQQLAGSAHNGEPVIRTVHALCLQVIKVDLRILLPHERESMIYDVLHLHPELRQTYIEHATAEQALREHEARIAEHLPLWQACRRWLLRHKAQLISDLPTLLLDKIKAGDIGEGQYDLVVVDEFQDLTPAEQELFAHLVAPAGQFVALGDSRQSIYAFRGNDRDGLLKLESLLKPLNRTPVDMTMTECQRCPVEIVHAANGLMSLYKAKPMVPVSTETANIHVVNWRSPISEARGMAKAIAENVIAHPNDSHLVMVTRRQFGYSLRADMELISTEVKAELNFSESLLEAWAVREAFLFFTLLADPDAPTWRAWLGYADSVDGKKYKSPYRNAGAYLNLLKQNGDVIGNVAVATLAAEQRTAQRGQGGATLWDRATRFGQLYQLLGIEGLQTKEELVATVFSEARWVNASMPDADTARMDMQLVKDKCLAILLELRTLGVNEGSLLSELAKRLRYQIATREPFVFDPAAQVHIATLWGAKGMTADHVYVVGLSGELMPGERRDEYPGTDEEYLEEQRRLFYVSLTRAKKTLVLSRGVWIGVGDAKRLGIQVQGSGNGLRQLTMSPFLRDVIKYLPKAVAGEDWHGCG
jgi:DNA helicase II / ATP-dependent DNA helicase PcrA